MAALYKATMSSDVSFLGRVRVAVSSGCGKHGPYFEALRSLRSSHSV